MLKIKKLLALGILEFSDNALKINTSKCKELGVQVELTENIMNMMFSTNLFDRVSASEAYSLVDSFFSHIK